MPGGGKGGASSTVTVHNGPVTVDADSTVEVVGLDKINITARLEPTPFKTESKQELILPQPLRTELTTKSDITSDSKIASDSKNAMSVDLKPVAVDLCLNTKLPHGQICQPFSFHVGMTLFGMELFGVNFGGETRTVMQDLPHKPAISWPAQHNASQTAQAPGSHRASGVVAESSGVRVRIK
jgi:hypothetical protein